MERMYELNEREAGMVFIQVSSHCEALKNWMASAVEAGETAKAKELVTELRRYQMLYAKLNTKAHREIDAMHAAKRENGK